MKNYLILLLSVFVLFSCKEPPAKENIGFNPSYFDYTGRDDQATGGIKMIPIETPKGTFKVWTKRVGNNPSIKVLLLHGGPGGTHEFFECFDGYFPQEGIEYVYYDQLDSYYSDKSGDTSLWTTEHFVEEVEQVRKALGMDSTNFYLLGQSWGGILAMEYALKYQAHIKGLIISNMMASAPKYEAYAKEVLGPKLPDGVFSEIMAMEEAGDFENPRYSELLFEHYYTRHILRKPLDEWPESITRAFNHLNPDIYIYMQGFSEFGMTGNATLRDWDVSNRLMELRVPTLMIGGKYDTMDPEYMQWMSTEVQNGRSITTNGSHFSQYDDPGSYFSGLIEFIKDVHNGTF